MDLDSIIHGLSELGAQLEAADEVTRTKVTDHSGSPLKSSWSKSGFQRKKPKHNVSFSDQPPVCYSSEPQSAEEYDGEGGNIYEGIDNFVDSRNDGSMSLASLLESRRNQVSIEEQHREMEKKSSRLDRELESVLRELEVLTEECDPSRTSDDDDDDDDDEFPPPPPIPPLPDFDGHYDNAVQHNIPPREHSTDLPSFPPEPPLHHHRPLSYGSNFSSDSITTTSTTNDSISNKSNDSRNDKFNNCFHYSFRHQNHSSSFSDSLPQVSVHPKNTTQTCIKIHSEDGSSKTVAVDRETSVQQLCGILIKKYRYPLSKSWSLVEQWNEACLERLLEGHLKVLDEVKKWPQNSDNRLWFANIDKKYALFNDNQISESLVTGSYVPNCEGCLYLKSPGKRSWKKLFFVLRSSGLYFSSKGKVNSSDLTCISNLVDVDIFTGFNKWDKLVKAPTRFGFALKPSSSSKLNAQNPLKFLCTEDARTLQRWMDALRIAKYGKQLYEDYVLPVVVPPPMSSQTHHVAASWSNLIEDELDRVANNQKLQKSSVSLRDCSRLNTSLDSPRHSDRRSDSIHSDEKIPHMKRQGPGNAEVNCRTPMGLMYSLKMTHSDLGSSEDQRSSYTNLRSPSLKPNLPLTFNVSNIISARQTEDIVGTLPRNKLNQSFVGGVFEDHATTSSLPFDKRRRSKDDSFIRITPAKRDSSDDPVYDYISDLVPGQLENEHQGMNNCVSPTFPKELSAREAPYPALPGPLGKSRSQDLLEDGNRGQYERNLFGFNNTSAFCRNSLHRMTSPLQNGKMNGDRRHTVEGRKTSDVEVDEKFDFPPPPTPEIFQFLAQNKNDLIPQKQHLYEVPVVRHPDVGSNGFYRRSSLNRSLAKDSPFSENVYRALNSYTPEPTEVNFSRGLHHSFHSGDHSTKQPTRSTATPLPPLRSMDTKLSGLGSPDAVTCHNSPVELYANSQPTNSRPACGTQNAIKLLNKMVEQKIHFGVSGPTNHQRASFDEEPDYLPPPPKELLENLRSMRSRDKQCFVFCNS